MLVVMVPVAAQALPAPYGSPDACKAFLSGGSVPAGDENLLVLPNEVVGHEFHCEAVSVNGSVVTLSCDGLKGQKGSTQQVTMMVMGSKLFYRDVLGSLVLHKCQ